MQKKGYDPELQAGDRVRIITSGSDAYHHLKFGVVVTIIQTEYNGGCMVQASGREDFHDDNGWSRKGIGKHLQYVNYSDFNRLYPTIQPEKGRSTLNLPLL